MRETTFGQGSPGARCIARWWCFRGAARWKDKGPLQANGGRQGKPQTTERSHLWPGAGRRRLPRLIGGSVFHVLNVAALISADESGGWFGCHLLGLCFRHMRAIHLNWSLWFSTQPPCSAPSAEELPAVQMLDTTSRCWGWQTAAARQTSGTRRKCLFLLIFGRSYRSPAVDNGPGCWY